MENKRQDNAAELVHVVGARLDETRDGPELAEAASYSRFYFQRLFYARTHETPGDCRRRLHLERAAYSLGRTSQPVTIIAFESGYESLEGFSRAFRKSFGVSPSHYRRLSPLSWYLAAPNDIHYDPIVGAAVRLSQVSSGAGNMDLTDRLIEYDFAMTRELLEQAALLSDEQLDAPFARPIEVVPFDGPENTLRDMLHRLLFTKEIWISAVQGRPMPPEQDLSLAGLQRRLEAAFGEWLALVRQVREQNLWDANFVDMLCEPPETFTYGGMIAHVLTFSTHRRLLLLQALQGHTQTNLGYGDPIIWEQNRQK